MRNLLAILLSMAAVTALADQQSYGATDDNAVRSCREASWVETRTLAGLPKTSRVLIEKTVEAALAEKGALWNGGCLIDPALSSRRLVLVGTARGQMVLVYEHGGGLTSHQHAVCFAPSSDEGQVVVANLEVHGISKAADIRKALASGEYRSVKHY
jgi:hypothetical protein